MKKLECIKLANSVKAGVLEETFLSDKKYDLTLEGDFIVKIVDPATKAETYTTLMNTIYWKQTKAKPAAKEAKP